MVVDDSTASGLLDARALSRLRWRCRRGMLENDLYVERFLQRYSDSLTYRQADGLTALMDLSDNDLLDLHLGRKTPGQIDPELNRDHVIEVLGMLREHR
jgi:antitoxin CptB